MNRAFTRAATAAALTAAVALGGAGSAEAATGTYTYTYTYSDHSTFDSDPGDSLCGTTEHVTIDGALTLHLVTALSDLSAGDVLDLWNNSGMLPDGTPAPISHFGEAEQGTFTDVTGGHTYTGTFTQSFSANAAADGTRFLTTGAFLARGTSELGTALRATSVGPSMFDLNGPVFDHTRNTVTGCLA
jgi:hypothetical protein